MPEELKIILRRRTKPPRQKDNDVLLMNYNQHYHRVTVTIPYHWGENYEDRMDEIQNKVRNAMRLNRINIVREGIDAQPDVSTKSEIEEMAISHMKGFELPLSLLSGFKWRKRMPDEFALITTKPPHIITINENLLKAPKEIADMTMAHEVCHLYLIHSLGLQKYTQVGYHGDGFWRVLSAYTGISVSRLQNDANKWLSKTLNKKG